MQALVNFIFLVVLVFIVALIFFAAYWVWSKTPSWSDLNPLNLLKKAFNSFPKAKEKPGPVNPKTKQEKDALTWKKPQIQPETDLLSKKEKVGSFFSDTENFLSYYFKPVNKEGQTQAEIDRLKKYLQGAK